MGRIFISGTLVLLLNTFTAHARSEENFGAPLRLTDETPLVEAIDRASEESNDPVLVRGRVTDVCQRKGCWTVLQSGDAHVRVRFKDYAFFVPTDCRGREALVEGVVEVKTLSAAMARHYEEEAQNGDPDAVRGPKQEVSMIATGVRLLPD